MSDLLTRPGAGGGPPSSGGDDAGGDPTPSGSSGPPTGGRAAWSLVCLVAALTVITALFLFLHQGALLVVIVAIIVMVMVHELGHFATAKWGHMKVTEYFLGFGPRLWSVRRGETEYGIKAIPAGGYVKIPGMTNLEEVDPADEPRTYRQQPFSRRLAVAVAGSVMHFVMAFLLAYGAILYFGNFTTSPKSVALPVAQFEQWPGQARNAAQQAGMRVGDVVVAVNGRTLSDPNQFTDTVGASPGKPVRLTVERGGRQVQLTVVPAVAHRTANGHEALGPAPGSSKEQGLIGVLVGTPVTVYPSEGPIRALGTAVIGVGHISAASASSLPHAVASLYNDITNSHQAQQDAQSGQRATSILGAGRLATQAEQEGILYLVEVLIALNVVFGIINMLPMLPLDGGHVAIAIYERIRTRRGRPYYQADAAKLLPVAYAFVAVLGIVALAAIYLDVAHPIANPFR